MLESAGRVRQGLLAILICGPLLGQGACSTDWAAGQSRINGLETECRALLVGDIGQGPSLYAGGFFGVAGSIVAGGIARYDGVDFTSLAGGLIPPKVGNGYYYYYGAAISAMTVFDDGTGPALIAAGWFGGPPGAVSSVWRWNGVSWAPLGTNITQVGALAVYDDGTGPALYASFSVACGSCTGGVMRWTGASWITVGGGLTANNYGVTARTMVVHDDGTGPALYVGGVFTQAGGVPANNIARWNGSVWQAVGGPLSAGAVETLVVHDDGTGPKLYAGGTFATAGAATVNHIARWDGTAWSALGAGVGTAPGLPVQPTVRALASFNDGTGPALVATGFFTTAGGTPCDRIARWKGGAWSPITPGIPIINSVADGGYALAAFDDGSGEKLYVSGKFRYIGGVAANNIARFDGVGWSPLTSGLNGPVRAFADFDDGTGPATFAAGEFSLAPGEVVSVAKWNGADWVPFGASFAAGVPGAPCTPAIRTLSVHDDGTGPSLYAGGIFSSVGGVTVNGIARWNGTSWVPVGGGVAQAAAWFCSPAVHALASWNDGSGPGLYAAGYFDSAGGVPANNIAKWNGTTWAPLGAGVRYAVASGAPPYAPYTLPNFETVLSLKVFDDGTGPALVAGGRFSDAGGIYQPNMFVARWNGVSWSPVGDSFAGYGAASAVMALAVADLGSSQLLVAAGTDLIWTTTNQYFAYNLNNVALLSGNIWVPLGNGLRDLLNPGAQNYAPNFVNALTVWDDGTGLALYAGGDFAVSGTVAVPGIARFDGVSWGPLNVGCTGWQNGNSPKPAVFALHGSGPGAPPVLHVGGNATRAGSQASPFVARWAPQTGPAIHNRFADRTVLGGSTLTLSVQGSGAPPLAFQWRKDGTPLPNGASDHLSFLPAGPSHDGVYDVVVTNGCGSATSLTSRLTVVPAILSLAQPFGSGSLRVVERSHQPGANWFTAASFDPLNAAYPGTGWLFGLYINPMDAVLEFSTGSPPFVGVFDSLGQSHFELPNGALGPGLVGAAVHAVTVIYTPAPLAPVGGSNIASLTIQ